MRPDPDWDGWPSYQVRGCYGQLVILVIDNYDSFTYNLVQLLRGTVEAVEVVRNDALPVAELLGMGPEAIVVSPGPGRPEEAGVAVELFRARAPVPILGVCLGHQALGVAFGARVERAPRLMHGKVSQVRHDGTGILAGIEDPFAATRYHSLAVLEEGLPDVLVPCAWSQAGTLQAMYHRELPYWGVQFHPESVLTTVGARLVENFLGLREGSGRPDGGDGGG